AFMTADLVGVALAFLIATAFTSTGHGDRIGASTEGLLFAITLPVWLFLFKLHGLYEHDEERADHSTADDLFGVVQVLTIGVWGVEIVSLVTNVASPRLSRLALFWILAIGFVTMARVAARAICRRQASYVQRVVVVGEGDIGQLVARKIGQHPEYGLELLGFIDGDPKGKRSDITGVATLGGLERLDAIVGGLDLDRVIVAF